MPDLGKYAVDVLSAYAVSVALIVGLVVLSLYQAGRMRRAFEQREGRRDD